MKNRFLLLATMISMVLVFAPAVFAQAGAAKSGPDETLLRDPEMEKDARHNLEVAKNYFKLKKAYVAALKRLEEIIEGNPTFSKIEEVYLMAGQSSLWLAESKGKQSPDQYYTFDGENKRSLTPDEFRAKGRDYLSRLVNYYPNGPYTKQAAEELRPLGGPYPKSN